MIVTPEFVRHWKTERLIEITGDKSAPLAVLNGWGFCQISRAWQFPDMTREQLAGVCRWGNMSPPCHQALLKAGFIERFGKGFAFHDWEKSNAQLIQKWLCGKKGGRPRKTGAQPEETGRFQPDMKPGETGRFPLGTDRKPGVNRQDKTGQAQTGLDEKTAHGVNIVKPATAHPDLTRLTHKEVRHVAKDIASNRNGWCYDNHKVAAAKLSSASVASILKVFVGKLTIGEVHECWRVAAENAHKAAVDGMVTKTPIEYAIGCFKEELRLATEESNHAQQSR